MRNSLEASAVIYRRTIFGELPLELARRNIPSSPVRSALL